MCGGWTLVSMNFGRLSPGFLMGRFMNLDLGSWIFLPCLENGLAGRRILELCNTLSLRRPMAGRLESGSWISGSWYGERPVWYSGSWILDLEMISSPALA